MTPKKTTRVGLRIGISAARRMYFLGCIIYERKHFDDDNNLELNL